MGLTYKEKLDPLRVKLDIIDQDMLRLLTERAHLVREVGHVKKEFGMSLQASDREAAMFQKMSARCAALGLDYAYTQELWSLIMWNSKIMECKEANRDTFMNKEKVDRGELTKNLLRLTHDVAPKYNDYCNGDATNAIRAYRAHEEKAFEECMLETRSGRDLALDLGCASGQVTPYLEQYFPRVHAYDVSPDMCDEAQRRNVCRADTEFLVHDLEQGIPEKDNSVSFVMANFGAASELGDDFLREVHRVLRPGGKAMLSYYNKDALVNHWFYPWPSTVHARLNPHNDTVEVWAEGSVYILQAKGETVENLDRQCAAIGLKPAFWETYPTVQSILASVFFQEEMFAPLVGMVASLDDHLARLPGTNRGTYILTTVTKQ